MSRRVILGVLNNSVAMCKQFHFMRACPTAIKLIQKSASSLNFSSSTKAHLHQLTSNCSTKRLIHSTSSRWNNDKNLEGNDKSSKPNKINDEIDKDLDEEMLRYDYEEFEFRSDEEDGEQFVVEDLPPHLCQRGQNGVFDMDQLVKLLKDEKAKDLCAISIPPEHKYCDHLVIVTGNSTRHLVAMAEKVKKYFKVKRNVNDPESVMIEGLQSGNWLALDIGNIVLHLFLEKQRLKYNLEELWLLGPEFDEHCIKAEREKKASSLSFTDFSFDDELEKFRNIRSKENEPKEQ